MGQFLVLWFNDNVYVTGENGTKISSKSHSNGPILVGQLRESQTKWVRVGKSVYPTDSHCGLSNAPSCQVGWTCITITLFLNYFKL